VIGPMMDRCSARQRIAMACRAPGQAAVGRDGLHFNDWLIYPDGDGHVLSSRFEVLKAAHAR